MCKISINSGTFDFGTNMGLAGGKYFIKIIFDIKIKISIFEILDVANFNKFLEFFFYFGTNLDLIMGKYFIKIILGIKTKIAIFEMSNVLNFNKF